MRKNLLTRIFFIFFGLLLGLYLAFPIYFPLVISSYLAKFDIKLLMLDVKYPGLNQTLDIHAISLAIPELGYLDIRNLRVERDERFLIEIDELSFSSANPIIADNQDSEGKLIDYLPSHILANIPTFDLLVENFSYNDSVILGRKLQLRKEAGELNLSTIAKVDDGVEYAFRGNIKDNNTLRFEIDDLTETISILSTGRLFPKGNVVDIKFETNLEISPDFNNNLYGKVTLFSESNFALNKSINDIMKDVYISNSLNVASLQTAYGKIDGNIYWSAHVVDGVHTLSVFDEKDRRLNDIYNRIVLNKNNLFSKQDIVFEFSKIEIPIPDNLGVAGSVSLSESLSVKVFLDRTLGVNVKIQNLTYEFSKRKVSFDLKSSVQSEFITNFIKDFEVINTSVDLDITATLTEEKTLAFIKNISPVRVTAPFIREYGISNLVLSIPPQSIEIVNDGFSLSSARLDLQMKHKQIKGNLLFNLAIKKAMEVTTIGFTNTGFFYSDQFVPNYRGGIRIDTKDSKGFSSEFQLFNACNETLASARLLHSESSSKLIAKIYKNFSKERNLKKWLNMEQLPFDITEGEVAIDFALDFIDINHANVINMNFTDLNLVNSLGSFDGIQLQFRSTTLDLSQADAFNTHIPFAGEIRRANVGLLSENIEFNGSLVGGDFWSVSVEKLEIPIFGGLASMNAQEVRLGDAWTLEVALKDIDLAELVDTQQIEGLSTSGVISGIIPISQKDGVFSIGDGRVSNKAGGIIHYVSPLQGSVDLNDQLKLTLDVLENFNYDHLNTKVAYSDGSLLLQSQISGKNPDVAGGKKVELNLNTEIELQSAFEVMRMQSGLEAQIEKFAGQQSDSYNNTPLCGPGT